MAKKKKPDDSNAHISTAQSAKLRDIKIEVVLVTPQLARQWLSESINANNRTLKKSHVETLLNEIRRGAWRANGDPLRFGSDGILYDGQHRLAAIVAADAALWCNVLRGVPPEARLVIDDIILRRSAGDVLEISGGGVAITGSWKKRTEIISVIARLHKNNNSRVTPTEMQDYWYVKFREGIEWAAQLPGGGISLSYTPIAAALAIAYCKDPSVKDFTEQVLRGDGLERGDPALALREAALSRDRRDHSSQYKREFSLRTFRAVHAHIRGERLMQLRPNDSSFRFFIKK